MAEYSFCESVHATGTYNGLAFDFVSDLEAEQEAHFATPLVVAEGASADLTLFVNLDGWFRDAGGALVDPATAAAGQSNESLVKENIKRAFDAFEDDNHDGEDDHGGDHGGNGGMNDGPNHTLAFGREVTERLWRIGLVELPGPDLDEPEQVRRFGEARVGGGERAKPLRLDAAAGRLLERHERRVAKHGNGAENFGDRHVARLH